MVTGEEFLLVDTSVLRQGTLRLVRGHVLVTGIQADQRGHS